MEALLNNEYQRRMNLMYKLKKNIAPEDYKNEWKNDTIEEFLKVLDEYSPHNNRCIPNFVDSLDLLYHAYSKGGILEDEKILNPCMLMYYVSRYEILEKRAIIRFIEMSEESKGENIDWENEDVDWGVITEEIDEDASFKTILNKLRYNPGYKPWFNDNDGDESGLGFFIM